MINYSIENNSICFALCEMLGEPAPIKWMGVCKGLELSQAILLNELIDNGNATLRNNGVQLTFSELLNLSQSDKALLQLPEAYPFDICVDGIGQLNQTSFRYKLVLCEYFGGPFLHCTLIGPFVKFENQSTFLLSAQQFALINSIESFNALPTEKHSFDINLQNHAKIRNLAFEANAKLDSYLNNENIILPEQVEITLSQQVADNFEVSPIVAALPEECQKKFKENFNKYPTIQSVYNTTDNAGQRIRVALNAKQKSGFQNIKSLKKQSQEALKEFIENPAHLLDPDAFDLDSFSKRVAELGLYKPRYYPFISRFKSEWLPGIIVEKSPEDRERITVNTSEELCSLKGEIQKAISNNDQEICYKNHRLPVSEAQNLVNLAQQQLKNTDEPVSTAANENDKKVLIIYENVFESEYKEEQEKVHSFRSFPLPVAPQIKVMRHQANGISWLQNAFVKGMSGVLLADDMGLGKTFQSLCFLTWFNEFTQSKKPNLIVTPLVIMNNWAKEAKRLFRADSFCFHYYENLNLNNITQLCCNSSSCNVVLATYESLRRNQTEICKIDWGTVILDEAQRIKTPGTLVTNSAKALKASFRLALTGTPVENTLIDLWCIVDFLVPGLLGSAKEFAREYQSPLQDSETDLKTLGEKLRTTIDPIFLRRLKTEILTELPKKEDIVKKTLMPPAQLQRYKAAISSAKVETDSPNKRNAVLSAIWEIRDISDHPYLPDKQIELIDSKELIDTSAKLKSTIEILSEIKAKGEKVIIFADRRKTQRMLSRVIYDTFGIAPSIVNGDSPTEGQSHKSTITREVAIETFQAISGFNIIIMSPIAAGVGLNIVGANNVIHYTRHWNPAKENQATDRVYRIGQKKPVYVFYPMSIADEFESFDLILDKLLRRKSNLANASLFPTERIEVNPEEIFKATGCGTGESGSFHSLSIKDIDIIDPYLFEAVVAQLFSTTNKDAILTPKSNDHGADVLVMGQDDKNYAIQVKLSSKDLGDYVIGEVLKAKSYYNDLFQMEFIPAIATNSVLNSSAQKMAETAGIHVFNRNKIAEMLSTNKISIMDVHEREKKRKTSL